MGREARGSVLQCFPLTPTPRLGFGERVGGREKPSTEDWPPPLPSWTSGRLPHTGCTWPQSNVPCVPLPRDSVPPERVPAVNNPERPSSRSPNVIIPMDVTHSQHSGGFRNNLLVPQTAL